ncbi:hypothetical protein ACLB1Q_35180 [Escherichia coli]
MSIREQLLALLEETADDRVTRFVWLRQFEPGSNSSSANRLLDGLGTPTHRFPRGSACRAFLPIGDLSRRQGDELRRRTARSPGGQAACDLGCLRLGMAGDVGRRSGRNPRTGSSAVSTVLRSVFAMQRSQTKRGWCVTP